MWKNESFSGNFMLSGIDIKQKRQGEKYRGRNSYGKKRYIHDYFCWLTGVAKEI